MALIRNKQGGFDGTLETTPDNIVGDCPETWNGYMCTLDEGHTNLHVAGGGEFVVAVWWPHESD